MNKSDPIPVQIHKGRGLIKNNHKTQTPKYFVFDLDETIGAFSDLYILYKCLIDLHINYPIESFIKDQLSIFPEFLRYGMLTIFKYISQQKQKGLCNGIYIYTNNTCIPVSWTTHIINFIETEIDQPKFFNCVIRAFKINGEILECKRTTTHKTYDDLIQCVDIPDDTEVCFIDDSLHMKMMHRYVLYIQPLMYSHHLTQNEIINRFIDNYTPKNPSLKPSIVAWYTKQGYKIDTSVKTRANLEVDIEVTKKIFYHIKKFFYVGTKRLFTKSIRIESNRKTRKNRLD